MSSNQHGLNVTKPVSLLNRSLKFSFKEFFKSMTKAFVKGATANYAQARRRGGRARVGGLHTGLRAPSGKKRPSSSS